MKELSAKCLEGLKNKKVILCVSGGVDSMVLLDIVIKYSNELNITPLVCHFEHGIRGDESVKDMELVERQCRRYGIMLLSRQENIPQMCVGENLEEFARNRRYAFFYECLKEQEADYLVLAHHKDDNCETLVMNIIRGCGTKGLCGMQKIRGRLFRPLLDFSKEQLYAYAKNEGIEFREDSTNADVSYLRNSIRHEIMPALKNKNAKIYDAIDRLREIASLENDFFEKHIAGLDWIIAMPYGYDIEVKEYLSAHDAIKRRSILYVLKRLSGKDYDYGIFETIDALSSKETGKVAIAPHGIKIYKREKVLSFVRQREPINSEKKLSLPGETITPFGVFISEQVYKVDIRHIKSAPKNVCYFSLEDNSKLTVRKRSQGDKINCFGGGTKKLKDVFINKKLPVFLRDFVPVVCCGDEILWIPGVMRSSKYPFNGEKGIRLEFIEKK